MVGMLVSVRGKQRDGQFAWSDFEVEISRPFGNEREVRVEFVDSHVDVGIVGENVEVVGE